MSLAKMQEVRTTQVLAPIRRPLRNASGYIPSFFEEMAERDLIRIETFFEESDDGGARHAA